MKKILWAGTVALDIVMNKDPSRGELVPSASAVPAYKQVINIVGFALTIGAVVFVVGEVYHSFEGLKSSFASPKSWLTIAASAIAYGLVSQLAGIAWFLLLAAIDSPSLGLGRALAIFGRTQIYKYLPSNVLHMVGRFAMAKKSGASSKALAFAQVGELSVIVLAAMAVAMILSRPLLIKAMAHYGLNDPTLITALLAAGFIALTIGAILLFRSSMASVGRKALGASVAAFFLYILFFIGNGLLIVVLCRVLNPDGTGGTAELIGIATAAWLIGFAVPGAPGGLGVREAVLITGLSSAGLPAEIATAVALGNRLVTTLGDCLVALAEMLLRKGRASDR